MHPHRLTANRYRCPAKVDLQLLARRCFEPHAGARLSLQRLAQRHDRALHGPQRHRHPVLAHQVLAHHIAVAAMPTETLRQPLLKSVETPAAWGRSASEQPPKRLVVDAVAFTGHRLQGEPVKNAYPAVAVFNEPGTPEFSGDSGHPRSANPQHKRQELVGNRHRVRLDAVACHQEPARAALRRATDRSATLHGRTGHRSRDLGATAPRPPGIESTQCGWLIGPSALSTSFEYSNFRYPREIGSV